MCVGVFIPLILFIYPFTITTISYSCSLRVSLEMKVCKFSNFFLLKIALAILSILPKEVYRGSTD